MMSCVAGSTAPPHPGGGPADSTAFNMRGCNTVSASLWPPVAQDLRKLMLASNGKELEGAEMEYELAEGPLHTGLGAVTRMVWQKSEA
eukprot:354258-Chlamydomonas_euryale.AAC.4